MQALLEIVDGIAGVARIVLEYDDGCVLTQMCAADLAGCESVIGSTASLKCVGCDTVCLHAEYDPRFHACVTCWRKNWRSPHNDVNEISVRPFYVCRKCNRPHKTRETLTV